MSTHRYHPLRSRGDTRRRDPRGGHILPGRERAVEVLRSSMTIDEDGDPADEDTWRESLMTVEGLDLEGRTVAQHAAAMIRDEGGYIYASASHFHKGVWYETEWSTANYQTGEEQKLSFRPRGFTLAEEREIFNILTGKKAKSR